MNPPPLPPPPPSSGPPPVWAADAPPVPWTPLPPAGPGWPKVLGITAIAFGAAGMLSHAAGFASTRLMGAVFRNLPGPMPFDDGILGLMNRYLLWNGTGCLLLGALLVTGGIGLLKRRRWARGMILAWAVGRMALAAGTFPMMTAYTGALMAKMAAPLPAGSAAAGPGSSGGGASAGGGSSATAPPTSPPPPGSGPAKAAPVNPMAFAAAMSRVGAYSSLLTTLAGPVFALIWFNRRKVREDLAVWTAGSGTPSVPQAG